MLNLRLNLNPNPRLNLNLNLNPNKLNKLKILWWVLVKNWCKSPINYVVK